MDQHPKDAHASAAISADFTQLIDLASERLGGAVIATNDDFFAQKENLIAPQPAEWKAHEYTDRGKWMDGWESRRKRIAPGDTDPHDWAILRLGVPGVVRGVVVDTSFFRGNFPEACSLEGSAAPTDATTEELLAGEWTPLLTKVALRGDSHNRFEVQCDWAFTHVRLRIHPDGGVARLRVHGEVAPDFRRKGHALGELDLAFVEHGGDVIGASDMFFGERRNLIMPGRAVNMSDGWETKRRRGPGHDWALVRLGARGTVTRVEIDTNHFKGNFPDTASLEGCRLESPSEADLQAEESWRPLLPQTKLQAHTRHYFEEALQSIGPVSHIRLRVYPDGGVSRLRVFGTVDKEARLTLGVRWLNQRTTRDAEAVLAMCLGAPGYAAALAKLRPFASFAALREASNRVGNDLTDEAILAAVKTHPRLGESKSEQAQTSIEARWSRGEQAGITSAASAAHTELHDLNRRYEAKFGWIYIVCASGKSAEELVAIGRARLSQSLAEELRRMRGELLAIAELRLEKAILP